MESILRKELKQWQRDFRTKHGREPTKRDMLKHPLISSTYETWTAITAESGRDNPNQPSAKRVKTQEQPLQRVPGQDVSHLLKTPTKPRPTASIELSSPSRNPFRTPTKVGAPSTLIKTPNSRSMATPIKGDSQYDYAASPSRLHTLVAIHSTTRSPNKKQGEGRLSSQVHHNLLVTYTPRTKARKRLRGEEVPPTPRVDGGRSSRRGSGAMFTAFSQAEDEAGDGRKAVGIQGKPGARGLAAYGFGSIGKDPSGSEKRRSLFGYGTKSKSLGSTLGLGRPAVAEDDQGEEGLPWSPSKVVRVASGSSSTSSQSSRLLSRSASTGSRSFKPLFASPSDKHSPQKLMRGAAGMTRTSSSSSNGGGIFAAEIEARRKKSFGTAKDKDVDMANSSDNERPPMPFSSVANTSFPNTGTTAPSLVGTAASADGAPAETRRAKQPSWKISTIVVSDDEESNGHGRSAVSFANDAQKETKTITVLPYQRYGSLRNKANSTSAIPDDDDSSDDELFSYALSHSPIKKAPKQQDEANTSETEGKSLLLSTLSLHSPSRGSRSALPVQARQAIRAQRLYDAQFLQDLLGAGRDELEVLQLDTEMPKSNVAKNWGEAKKREKIPDPKKRGRGKAPVAESQQQPMVVEEPPELIVTSFARAGRSGLADDEDGVLKRHFEEEEGEQQQREESDDDWASEVESEEYGLGDGRMDAVDVM